jgi:GntR family transcriptional regulator
MNMVQLHISPASDLPIYRQIMRQITDAIAAGRLRRGEKVPSHRDLAESLVISPLTVKKAYEELERAGLLQTQRGRGTFVSATRTEQDVEQQRRRFRSDVRRLLSAAHLGGLTIDDVRSLLDDVHVEFEQERAAADGARESADN